MLLRGQNVDLLNQIYDHPNPSRQLDPQFTLRLPERRAIRSRPRGSPTRSRAKMFIAGAWQDEQTGGHWANMLDRFAPGMLVARWARTASTPKSLDPTARCATHSSSSTSTSAHKTPAVSPVVRAFAPVLWSSITGISGLSIPPDRFTGMPPTTSPRAVRGRATSQDPLGDRQRRRAPHRARSMPAGQTRYSAPGPSPRRVPRTWHLRTNGRLAQDARRGPRAAPTSYRPDPDTATAHQLPRAATSGRRLRPTTGNPWWTAHRSSYFTHGAEADLDDGRHRQCRSLDQIDRRRQRRAGHDQRSDAQRRGALRAERLAQAQPPQTRRGPLDRAASRPLRRTRRTCTTSRRATSCRRGSRCFPFAHQFRAGSQIRLTIQAPGGDRPNGRSAPLPPTARSWTSSPTMTTGRRGSCCRSSGGPDLGPTRGRRARRSVPSPAAPTWCRLPTIPFPTS